MGCCSVSPSNSWCGSLLRSLSADARSSDDVTCILKAGPYSPREIIMMPFAHNPTAVRAPDGTYLIYHIGCGTPNGGKPCTDCKGGVTGKTCHGNPRGEMVACNNVTTNILHSQSVEGPWSQLNAPIVYSATMGHPFQIDNPTVTFFANGSLLMLGRGGDTRSEYVKCREPTPSDTENRCSRTLMQWVR